MKAYPLEQRLRDLRAYQRVYIVRHAMVYTYPACIVEDIANDRYTIDDDWSAMSADWDAGERFEERTRTADMMPNSAAFEELVWQLWRLEAAPRVRLPSLKVGDIGPERVILSTTAGTANAHDIRSRRLFDLWWESVDAFAPRATIGAAARVAARQLMTFPGFAHALLPANV
ncbi:hypothetical protein [Xanthomonas phage XPV3]|nr:hypothetical protein [Xanthomonas phage XPV3]